MGSDSCDTHGDKKLFTTWAQILVTLMATRISYDGLGFLRHRGDEKLFTVVYRDEGTGWEVYSGVGR
jgi:hypothetical protein